jgi:Rrf2 family protein
MLHLSHKVRLAISAVLDIAYNSSGQPVSSSTITQRHNVPKRYLEPLLQQLVRDSILISERGPKGGYRLAKARAAITLGDVARAVDSPDTHEQHERITLLADKVLSPLWQSMSDDIFARLDTITLQELCDTAHRNNISSDIAESLTFII